MNSGVVHGPRESLQKSAESGQLETPILFIIFNRPDTTRLVFEAIRSARPAELYVAADGPRVSVESDRGLCEAARQIATGIDWNCAVRTRFLEGNVGCGLNVSSAITWFFEHVKEGIILEDDCVPSRSFFPFCEEVLRYYRADSPVMHVGGDNFQYGQLRGKGSYYFSRFAHTWGWATWQRAWRHYDFDLRPSWELRDTWDTQWQLSIEKSAGCAIVPNANLVRNVGFGPAATHTTTLERASKLTADEIALPLVHPASRLIDSDADRFTYYVHFRNVRHPQWIWAYRLWDWCYALARLLKQRVRAL